MKSKIKIKMYSTDANQYTFRAGSVWFLNPIKMLLKDTVPCIYYTETEN